MRKRDKFLTSVRVISTVARTKINIYRTNGCILQEWNKHWFVLRGCGLMYYRDPCAEDKGIMDGVIDLNTVTAVTPLQVARNYGFQTVVSVTGADLHAV